MTEPRLKPSQSEMLKILRDMRHATLMRKPCALPGINIHTATGSEWQLASELVVYGLAERDGDYIRAV